MRGLMVAQPSACPSIHTPTSRPCSPRRGSLPHDHRVRARRACLCRDRLENPGRGSSQTFSSIALPLLVGVLLCAILAISLNRRLRAAYVITLVLGILPAFSWAYLVVADNSF